jgi:uncharacterized protein (DUF2252 family)
MVNVSFPTGAVNATVHERPLSVVVQFGELLLMSATVAAPPFAEIETDTAEFETYFGVRAVADGDGAAIVRTSFPATKACEGRALGVLALPPPPHPARVKATMRTPARFRRRATLDKGAISRRSPTRASKPAAVESSDDSIEQRLAAGKARRGEVPRSSHAAWTPAPNRDPLALLEQVAQGCLAELLPLRIARMAESPFTFLRGSAIVMAADLADSPATGFLVQAGGDAHCLNYGGFATPERHLIFDINDFDETYPGPWEWDLKRLLTSLLLAGRHRGFKERSSEIAVLSAAEAYRTRMNDLAAWPALDVFYARLDAVKILEAARNAEVRARRSRIADQAATNSAFAAVEQLTTVVDGARRFKEEPPLLFHSPQTDQPGFDIVEIFRGYPGSLRPDIQELLGRYRLIDHAIKVVGVGSVGTRCGVGLFEASEDDAMVLQVKEARASVLTPYVPIPAESKPVYANEGERVVRGQHLMQAASDVFLGWSSSGDCDFYVRQYKDMKTAADLDTDDEDQLREYGHWCAWALATAHARSGDPARIAGYIGGRTTLDRALLAFAKAYAQQTEHDHAAFVAKFAPH